MASSSSSSSTRLINYDVFLSFRGEDTRRTVVSYLYQALCREGIFTFKDDQKIQKGDNISQQLIEAIKTSWFAIVIISENYATSTWCLEELRLIMELHSENQMQVVPIFYEVNPSDVRNQTGSFRAAFQKYENQDKPHERVYQWKKALYQIGNLAGFHSPTSLHEAAMISDTVRSVSSRLQMRQPTSWINLVGMEAHIVAMHFRLNTWSENDVLMIAIWGMGGIGKTTIAKCLYERFSLQFPARYFMDDIKKTYEDKSSTYLQEKFLSGILSGQHFSFQSDIAGSWKIKEKLQHQKVFVVLDGVDKADQLHALAKETSWFGPGSRIIITTQDKGLLNLCGVNNVYEPKCLDDTEALQVFRNSAFGGKPPPSYGFEQLFIRASQLAHGLPSALVAYAKYLSESTTTEEWKDELDLLETTPHKNVEAIVRNSYDKLDEGDKATFLHVACLFNGYPLDHVTSLLDNGRPRMRHLTSKSLISKSTDGRINMHFLVEQTGRTIVRQISKNRPFKQRFLWDASEIYDVLAYNRGTDKTEGVSLHTCKMTDKLPMSNGAFSIMRSMKYLKFFQHLSDAESNVQLRQDDFEFPHSLRLLHWDAYPLKSLPSTFQHRDLVELNLQHSNLETLWDRSRTVSLWNLRRLDVTGSKNLTELPDLSKAMKLEELAVEGCIKLRQIPESLWRLNNLTKLNAINCGILKDVKFEVELADSLNGRRLSVLKFSKQNSKYYFLTDLSIEGQISIRSEGLSGETEHLSFGSKPQLNSDDQDQQSIAIKRFSHTEYRSYFLCSSFKTFTYMTELKLINLNIRSIPEDIGGMQFLETLDLEGNDVTVLPKTMTKLPKLKYLSLRNCRKLKRLPQVAQVETLILSDCVNLVALLQLNSKENWNPYCLLELWLDNCNNVQQLPHQLRHLTKLTYLDLSRNHFVTMPTSISEVTSLGTLFLNNCKKLKCLQDLPLRLKHLYAHGCDSLEKVSLSPNHSIKHLDLIHCPRLNQDEHKHLMNLFLYDGEGSRRCVCLPKTGTIRRLCQTITQLFRYLLWIAIAGNLFMFLFTKYIIEDDGGSNKVFNFSSNRTL